MSLSQKDWFRLKILQAHLNKDETLCPVDQWVGAFERQFPDLIDNPIARMCFREGWSNAMIAPEMFKRQNAAD